MLGRCKWSYSSICCHVVGPCVAHAEPQWYGAYHKAVDLLDCGCTVTHSREISVQCFGLAWSSRRHPCQTVGSDQQRMVHSWSLYLFNQHRLESSSFFSVIINVNLPKCIHRGVWQCGQHHHLWAEYKHSTKLFLSTGQETDFSSTWLLRDLFQWRWLWWLQSLSWNGLKQALDLHKNMLVDIARAISLGL